MTPAQPTGGILATAKGAAPTGSGFAPPNIDAAIPPEQKDAVDRIVAAGMHVMYSPGARAQMQQAIQMQAPVPQKLAQAACGITLILDKQAKGGLPMAAIYPAAVKLMVQCAQVLIAAHQPVSTEDFREAMRILYALIGKKLGANDQQLMQGAQQAIGGQGQPPAAAAPGGAVPPSQPGGMPPPGGVPPSVQQFPPGSRIQPQPVMPPPGI